MEKERLRPKICIVWCSSLLWRQDQVEDQYHNESNISRPMSVIKNKVCVMIWI